MNSTTRQVVEAPLWQGEDERIYYTVTTTPWGSTPTTTSMVIKDADGTDVTSTYATGSTSVLGDVITLPLIHSLADGAVYRVEVKFTVNSNVVETWFDIYGQR